MATTTTLTSELEAINTILVACDEAPVASIALTGLYPLTAAITVLNETSRVVQSTGWAFNTEDDYPLTADGSGLIALSGNILSFDADDKFNSSLKRPVSRGLRLYNAIAHTYVWTVAEEITGTAIVLLEWTDLPQPVRHYITIRAARTMQGRTNVSDATYRISADDEQAALLACGIYEADQGDHNMLTDSWSVASVLFGREMIR